MTTMKETQEHSPISASKAAPPTSSVDLYAVQCGKCFKWRLIPSQEEFEELRSRFTEDPFVCTKKTDVTCDDPADIDYDASRTWIIDKPNLPKTPKGFKRQLVLRRDFSKLDAYYVTPSGKRVRSVSEVAAFINSNPELKDVCSVTDFSFHVPKIMEDTIPDSIDRKSKKMKSLKDATD